MTLLVTRPREQYPPDAFDAIEGVGRGRLRAAAWLAQLAYEDDLRKVDSIAADWSLRRIFSLAPHAIDLPWRAETRLHVLVRSDLTVVTFCGTDPLRFANWVTDLQFLPADGGVHRGFLAALDAVWPRLAPVLDAATGRLWVAGHSLGAALAALCALRCGETSNIAVDAVFAFGMPRVGGEAFATRYEAELGKRTLRLVHGLDVVPLVPPPSVGYRHVGRRLSCERGGAFDPAEIAGQRDDLPSLLRPRPSFATLTASLAAPRPDPIGTASALLPPFIADHLPDRYCAACEP